MKATWIEDLDRMLHDGISPQEAARRLGKRWDMVVRALGSRELTDRPLGPHVVRTPGRGA